MNKEKVMMSRDIVDIVNCSKCNSKEVVNEKINDFYKKYNSYYNNNQVRQKLRFYKENLYSDIKKCKIKVEEKNLKRLNKVIKIYSSDISDYEKIEMISKYFSDYNSLWDSYYDLVIPFLGTKFIKNLNKIYMFLKNNKDILEFVVYYSKVAKIESSYNYCKYIINLYIDNNISYNLGDFLDDVGIDIKIFNYCIYVIEELDVDLYNKFMKIKDNNDLIELEYNKKQVGDFIYALNNGVYKDGTKFSLSEFMKRIVFKYNKCFYKDLLHFVSIYFSEYYDSALLFLKNNQFHKRDSTKQIDFDDLMRSEFFIISRYVTDEEKKKVLTYMIDNGFPMFKNVFYDILRKYVKNEIVLSDLKGLNKKKVLIP